MCLSDIPPPARAYLSMCVHVYAYTDIEYKLGAKCSNARECRGSSIIQTTNNTKEKHQKKEVDQGVFLKPRNYQADRKKETQDGDNRALWGIVWHGGHLGKPQMKQGDAYIDMSMWPMASSALNPSGHSKLKCPILWWHHSCHSHDSIVQHIAPIFVILVWTHPPQSSMACMRRGKFWLTFKSRENTHLSL